jgi:hypothetical protein
MEHKTMVKVKVSSKQIASFMSEIAIIARNLTTVINKMPDCSKKTSLLTTSIALNKKVEASVHEISEQEAVDYVNRHPEVLQKLAHMARSDEGFKEVASEIVTPDEIKEDKTSEKVIKKKRL